MKDSLIIFVFFAAGIAMGSGMALPDAIPCPEAPLYALYALILFVGIVIGGDPRLGEIIRGLRPHVLLVPCSIVLGTLGGSALYAWLFDSPGLADTLAIGSGFGYYSLSSVMIDRLSGNSAGAVALLANMAREVFTLLFTPLLVRCFGKLAPIASGGATAMDTTLPVIAKFSGKEMSFVAVISGLVLTLATPVLISLIYRFL